MSYCNSKSFLNESAGKLLWRNSFPMVGAILALLAYELLESSLLAMQSERILTGFGFTLPITVAMSALAIAFSVQANNTVIKTNSKNQSALPEKVSFLLLRNSLVVLFTSLVFFTCSSQLLELMGNNAWLAGDVTHREIQDQNSYVEFRSLGWLFLALIWQANGMLRALGWMNLASGLILTWASIKAILALLLLLPESPLYQGNIASLGLVHITVDFLIAAFSLLILFLKVPYQTPSQQNFKKLFTVPSYKTLLLVTQQFITPLSMAVLTAIAANIDTSFVAALALLFRLEVLFLLLPMVLTTSMPALIGVNHWSDKKQRVKQLYAVGFSAILVFQVIVALLAYTQGHLISDFVCPHETIAKHLEYYLAWVPWGYASAGMAIVLQSCLNAKDRTVTATLLGLSHRIVLLLPLTYVGAIYFGTYGFYQGLMLGHLAIGGIVILMLLKMGYISEPSYLHKKIPN